MPLFFTALVPPWPIQEKVWLLKEKISEKYNARHALRLPAHITLQAPFRIEQDQVGMLKEQLIIFGRERTALKLSISGFGAFPPRVVFLQVFPVALLRELYLALNPVIESFSNDGIVMRKTRFHPHITLATKDLTPGNFHRCWEENKDRKFSESFMADGLYLFRHNGTSWDHIEKFPFSGVR